MDKLQRIKCKTDKIYIPNSERQHNLMRIYHGLIHLFYILLSVKYFCDIKYVNFIIILKYLHYHYHSLFHHLDHTSILSFWLMVDMIKCHRSHLFFVFYRCSNHQYRSIAMNLLILLTIHNLYIVI